MSALRADNTTLSACKRLRVAEGLTSDWHPHFLLGRLELGRGREDLLAVDLESPLPQYEITHVEADLLHDLVAIQHVGTAGSLVLDLVGPILIPLGPAVDRRVELQAESLDGVAGVEVEQPVVVW